jgi:hypothetical protein
MEKYKPDLLPQLATLDSGTLDGNLFEEILNAVTPEIATKGFLKNDKESYKYGVELETIIDKLVDSYLTPTRKKGKE